MNNSGDVFRDDVAFPILLVVPENRCSVLIVGGSEALRPDQRRVDQLFLSRAVKIRPGDVMRGRKLVDLLDVPRLPGIALMMRQPNDTLAVGGLHGEVTFESDLWNSIAVDVGH